MTKTAIPASAPQTPMMAQYHTLKAQAADCLLFYRMGDFFELFFDDAVAAAACLDIALTSRGDGVPMCGVPAHSAEGYLARLIKGGHRVAIAEQTETPAEAKLRGSKSLVARAIVRVVTAGTLTEDALLDSRSANWLVAACPVAGLWGVAAADISTGRLELMTVGEHLVPAELARLQAAEVILPDQLELDALEGILSGVVLTRQDRRRFDSRVAEETLLQMHGVATLDGFGQFDRPALAAAGGLLAYLDRAGQGRLPWLAPPSSRQAHDRMLIDAATRESLELVRSSTGERRGSLLDAIDFTVTGAGARQLQADVSAPLMQQGEIDDRLDLVGWFVEDSLIRAELRGALRSMPDMGRAAGRLAAGRGGPRDLAQIRDGLDLAARLHGRLRAPRDLILPPLLAGLLPSLIGHGELIDLLARALVAEPPLDAAHGGYIAEGYDPALDALRSAGSDGRRAIAVLEQQYRDRTGIAALKIRHNNVLGYHIEVSAKNADPLMAADSGFTHRQTLAGVVRFNAPELHEEAMRVVQSGSHAVSAEAAHLEELTDQALRRAAMIAATADALARLDVASALAEGAAQGGWCRPMMTQEPIFTVEAGRHPVVERAIAQSGARFVANDVALGDPSRLWLVTGPNMGGKSTFLRQNALIAVLAQAGSFVPAQSAHLGVVDRLFSRVGASDNLAKGRSTFMVEMVETAAILSQATPQSLVILDEVGRGTSTYDGLAIAWAVVEAVHEVNRARCLFATHYHELTRLAETLDSLSLHHVRAREHKGDLVLLHELADGPADRSYGLAVARLAGLPAPVVARAKSVLAKLEAGRAATGGLAAGLDDLPLFAALVAPEPEESDPLRSLLEEVSPDQLSPREALDLIYQLKAAHQRG
ncbi:DNA mismatch repair protein MutS [Aquisediminimonas sediminicola]|uniref:DNA mismatch repair protein MutS n=1 Tax=Alteraquisediminimonas sediminicola TaxID=2676787 RepID=UPI001FE4BD51|nr:DNA mismatch repair protein MutS [Aquisediminimonas sediminicola]